MTASSRTRFTPKNPSWYEDLAARESEIDLSERLDSPVLDEDLNHIDENYLEISRTSSVIRGLGVLIGILFFLSAVGFFIPFLIYQWDRFFAIAPFLCVYYCVMLVGGSVVVGLFALHDCLLPRDTPVRFNRNTRKIYAYEYKASLQRLQRWRTEIKIYDWDQVEAEIAKVSASTGKTYVVRHELVLVICKAGTNEVIDRIALKGNDVTVETLYQLWSYIRRFMAYGPARIPELTVRVQGVGLVSCLFHFMPYISPTEEGRRFRSKMRWLDYPIIFLTIWFFWIWLPLGICHYIAMKCAPEPHWPAEVDEESRRGKKISSWQDATTAGIPRRSH
ncbi:hypothetical protein G5B88_03775 [Herbaspirillum seropedicae]|uniref:DUF6708 domain-containing protein n=1 Tax=Herbaspirillum seropedicae (strain SmR1) TaxID=757424 RepID=D8IZF1_HERSS|nr:DUF6708 domain-containing protein [Herbaspirillum seropedicae]ADJ62271.1 hypothetical protein Hsero_0752 [Herbaspirillum seropedicae SmR1]AKN64429.1 hypothetical protein ACP92_03755 [Herbaspirillum seropedicae]UMU20350.1 hypothetical protein G5B88_03775 [Herbaspirillum seropedicae]